METATGDLLRKFKILLLFWQVIPKLHEASGRGKGLLRKATLKTLAVSLDTEVKFFKL